MTERLAGMELGPGLRPYLLEYYGEGGIRDRWHARQEESRASCEGNCNGCGICRPFCDDPLLEQLFVVLGLHELGRFSLEADCYETAKRKVSIAFDGLPDRHIPF